MAVAQKFLFDQSFDGPAPPPRPGVAAAGRAAAPPEPTFTRTELQAAEAKARAEGHAAGAAEAVSRHEAALAAGLAALGEGAGTLLAETSTLRLAVERDAVELARGILAKLFPALARRDGLGEIAALVERCMRECLDEPRLVLRVPDALFEAAQQRVAPLASGAGYSGKLVILADAALSGADCRVEWADGGAERDLGRAWQEVEAAMRRAFATSDDESQSPQPAAAGAPQETQHG